MTRILLFLAPLALSVTLQAAERRVVFAVVTHDRWAIEPIVALDPIEKPAAAILRRGDTLDFSRDGDVIGKVTVGEPVSLGCVSAAAKATVEPDRAVGESFIATNFTPKKAREVREASNEERAMLRGYAQRYLRARGLSTHNLEDVIDVVDLGDGEPLFVASLITNTTAMFVLARVSDVSSTRLTPQLVLAGPRDPDGNDGREPLFALLDLDDDGMAEVITQRHHKEGYDYVVYRRRGGRWTAFEGGGSGC
jgi:hypothetical protein